MITTPLEYNRIQAESGDMYSQSYIGNAYYTGRGLQRDYARAREWFLRAAEQGEVLAQERLYVIYYRGLGVGADKSQAIKWAKRAAESGNVKMQAALGWAYLRGAGVERDPVLAYAWMTIAELYGYRTWYGRILRKSCEKDLGVKSFESMQIVKKWQEHRNGKVCA